MSTTPSLKNFSSSQATQRSRLPSSLWPPDKDQRLVTTPYGRGLVIRTRPNDKIQEIELLEWQTTASSSLSPDANGSRSNNKSSLSKQPPVLYTATQFPSVLPVVGDDVVCLYGRGRVVEISTAQEETQHQSRSMIVVELSNWRLAQRCAVKCYLRLSDVQVVRKKTLYEMDSWERVRYAQECKTRATSSFQQKDFDTALSTYERAVTAVRYVQHDATSDNYLRGDLLLVMITSSNNAATCCIQLQRWQQAVTFSNNALVLLDALYEKRGLKIHSLLNKDGYSDARLFGEWKIKSLLLKANGLMEQAEYTQALAIIKNAHAVISHCTSTDRMQTEGYSESYAVIMRQAKQLKRLHATCVERKRALKKKEKQRAQAMFVGEGTSNSATVAVGSNKTTKTTTSSNRNKSGKEHDVPPSNGSKSAETKSMQVLDIASEENDASIEVDLLPAPPTRSVSFSDDTKPGTDDEERPWYDEHKEAFILSSVVGLAALSVVLLRSRK